VLQLELLKAQQRGGSPYVHIMHNVASRLRPEQMQAVARFYASLPPGPELPPGLELPRAPLMQAAPGNFP
jgi:cytochrome c553